MNKKINNLFFQKIWKGRTFFMSCIVVVTLTSCNKNNDEIAAETQTNGMNAANLKKGQLGGQEITYEKKDGLNFFQGDIVLSDQQLAEGGTANKGGASLYKWPSGKIYYTIAGNMGSINVNKINTAVSEYNNKTNTQWIPRTNQSNYVEFIFGSSNGSDGWAHIGYQGGKQTISLDQYISVGSVIHEMGHTVGLYHEHARQDRDQYVSIQWNNIQDGQAYNFNKYTSGTDIGPFNINSVMMYWPNSYSKNGQPTIKRANNTNFTYNRTGFTTGDINTINTMYP
ncbi:M12 family metallopeptidase [Chryseobacterium jejuense]|uniref:Astacin (Peptidase family M12A) n=1 Tax=Chryseobacterium jejuense TaxID=445960 RepID=A0A2X2Z6A3_CHRJE|nr:M12 family metallopeptidase [Chryseobacterium jejuense]SDJ41282.1 Astacin (Peptidase family M12A) [Chryseobacterium jejuense]SQB45980.1 Flavastacin precursor [Chryseobacterium jejuense]